MIKLLKDYTGRELESLTDEQVNKVVDLECADAGAPLEQEAPAPYVSTKPEKDVTLYTVDGVSYHFQNQADAVAVAEFISRFPLFDNDYLHLSGAAGYEHYAHQRDRDVTVGTIKTYSASIVPGIKEALIKDGNEKARFEKESKEYKESESARSTVRERVWNAIIEARDFASTRERHVRELNRYVELADKNFAVGLRFFEKRYPEYVKYLETSISDAGELKIVHKAYENPEHDSGLD